MSKCACHRRLRLLVAVIVVAMAALVGFWALVGTRFQRGRRVLLCEESPVYCATLSPDDKYVAAATLSELIVVEVASGSEVSRRRLSFQVTDLVFSPDGDRIHGWGGAGRQESWNVRSGAGGAAGSRLPWHAWQGKMISSDGRLVVKCEGECSATPDVVDITESTGSRLQRSISTGQRQVNGAAISPNGKMIATAGGQTDHPPPIQGCGDIRLWEVQSGELIGTLRGYRGAVSSVEFSRNRDALVSSSYDGTVVLWCLSDCMPQWPTEDGP